MWTYYLKESKSNAWKHEGRNPFVFAGSWNRSMSSIIFMVTDSMPASLVQRSVALDVSSMLGPQRHPHEASGLIE